MEVVIATLIALVAVVYVLLPLRAVNTSESQQPTANGQ